MTPKHEQRLLHFRWDLDKTYLRTDFDTVRDLVRTFRQKPQDKKSIPGAAALLRELLRASSEHATCRVTFISGSPRQMRKTLVEKLRLDGIDPDDFILKPNLSNLLRLRIKAIRGQVGYKLEALLQSRVHDIRADEVLFGDDAEQDALIYSLYADLIDGRIPRNRLDAILKAADVYRSDALRILHLAERLQDGSGDVLRIFIHLERRSPVSRFDALGRRVVPVFNYFQAAVVLRQDGLLDDDSLVRVTDAMARDGYTPRRLANSLHDLARRGFVTTDAFHHTLDTVRRASGDLHVDPHFLADFARHAEQTTLQTLAEPAQPRDIDYEALARGTHRYRRSRFLRKALGWIEG